MLTKTCRCVGLIRDVCTILCLVAFPAVARAQLRHLELPELRNTPAAMSHDGKLLAVSLDNTERKRGGLTDISTADVPEKWTVSTVPKERGIGVWELDTGKLAKWIPCKEFGARNPEILRFAPAGDTLAALHEECVVLLNPRTGETKKIIRDKQRNFRDAMDFCPTRGEIAVLHRSGNPQLYDATSGNLMREFEPRRPDKSLAYSADGKRLASGFCVWEVETETLLGRCTDESDVDVAIFDPKDAKIMYGIKSRTRASVVRWDIRTNRQTARFDEASRTLDIIGGFNDLAISSSGKLLATAGTDGRVRLWDIEKGTHLASLQSMPRIYRHAGGSAHSGQEPRYVEFSRDGNHLVYTTWDGNVHVWQISNIQKGQALNRFFAGDKLFEESLSNPPPVSASGKAVSAEPLSVGQKVLVRDPEGKWYAGCILEIMEDGKARVHRNGWPSSNDLTVTRSRLQLP